ncbi:FAD-dependent thymidylate synthase [Cupriavidus campinensis]|uniref:FAD-dependent thymidylate synthase n=1 Tax=Cupriavidus campinensis TaxID=151783 RepID=A0ABY3ESY7_9BURK|nr:FAD-dependent thymidylate synthase [Cupriavidus campinensis]TSP14015.1 FAD-dependent thymidylate synthase [Cupriavidus campinensis]
MIIQEGKGCRVTVVEHSEAFTGKPIATLLLRYWRSIHAELMTHRAFSRNAGSSRAIPVARMIEQVRNDPAGPIHWGKNQRGMQAKEELQGVERDAARAYWREAAGKAARYAECMEEIGAHKQVVNRILEPFQFIHVVVTATEWDNWFELRDHEDAQPEIQDLARTVREALSQSTPVKRARERQLTSSWHLPFVTAEERAGYPEDPTFLAQLSTARCARASYLTHDGIEPKPVEDLDLFERLVAARPLHASPTEHQAYPLPLATQQSKNFYGWRQHRELVEHRFR